MKIDLNTLLKNNIHENSLTKIMNLDLTKKESKLLNDVFIYMIDYINDDCFSNSDRKSFDSIYSKLKEKSK